MTALKPSCNHPEPLKKAGAREKKNSNITDGSSSSSSPKTAEKETSTSSSSTTTSSRVSLSPTTTRKRGLISEPTAKALIEQTANATANATTTNASGGTTTATAELSSYIKRSLSGLFSDIALAQADADDPPAFQQQDTSGAPVRKRSRTNLMEQAALEEEEQQQPQGCTSTIGRIVDVDQVSAQRHGHPTPFSQLEPAQLEVPPLEYAQLDQPPSFPRHPEPSSRTLSRRRSFSYQCLNKLFHIDDEPPAPPTTSTSQPLLKLDESDPHGRRRSSPRTVTGSERPPEESPFALPQPPLEESESMSSFIKILGAVDLDSAAMDDDDDDDDEVDEPVLLQDTQRTTTHPEDASFGWYVSEETTQTSSHNKAKPSSFLPSAVPDPVPPQVQQPTQAELESARAADTIDSVLGDFFG